VEYQGVGDGQLMHLPEHEVLSLGGSRTVHMSLAGFQAAEWPIRNPDVLRAKEDAMWMFGGSVLKHAPQELWLWHPASEIDVLDWRMLIEHFAEYMGATLVCVRKDPTLNESGGWYEAIIGLARTPQRTAYGPFT